MASKTTRRLIWVPVVHTQAELGTLAGSVRDAYVRRFGHGTWAEHLKTVDHMWRTIRDEINARGLAYDKVRLYQDGLPHCGHEADIVEDLARAGSPNHRLLLELMGHGARLTGTESPELLVEEYALAQQMALCPRPGQPRAPARRHRQLAQALLARRDDYIARRINATLEDGETGLLFLGLLHRLEERLAADVELVRLFPACPGRGPGRARRPRQAGKRSAPS